MESWHEDPKIAEIGIALSKLEGSIKGMADEWGYEITRSADGAFHIPRRWITHATDGDGWLIRHQAEILIGVPITVRLERGFYPEIPLEITAGATLKHLEPHSELLLYRTIEDGLLYRDAAARLPKLFTEIKALHDDWDFDYITEHGETIEEFCVRCKAEEEDES